MRLRQFRSRPGRLEQYCRPLTLSQSRRANECGGSGVLPGLQRPQLIGPLLQDVAVLRRLKPKYGCKRTAGDDDHAIDSGIRLAPP
jgi:hypothetical protein